jgi:hypothetical protein
MVGTANQWKPFYSIRRPVLTLTVLGVLWFARSISKPVNVVIEGLNEGADQVASASGQQPSGGPCGRWAA